MNNTQVECKKLPLKYFLIIRYAVRIVYPGMVNEIEKCLMNYL